MNILFIHSAGIYHIGGGISKMTYLISQCLSARNYNIYFLSLNKKQEIQYESNQFFFPDSDIKSDINISYFEEFIKAKMINVLINQAALNRDFVELTSICRKKNVRVISVIHNALSDQIDYKAYMSEYMLNKKGLGILTKIYKKQHVIALLKLLYKLKYKRLFKNLTEVSDLIMLVSKQNLKDFNYMVNHKTKRIFNPKVITIPNAIIENNYKLVNKRKEILWVGTPDFSIKKIDYALKIWKLLQNEMCDWTFTIIGDSHYLDEAKKLASTLSLERISFEGRRDPIEYYKRSSILFLTSTSESFGLVLIEAMSYGVVPIAFKSFPAIIDIIDDDVNGHLVSPFNLVEYASKVYNLSKSNDKLNSMSLKSIEKSSIFNSTSIINQWISMLNNFNEDFAN